MGLTPLESAAFPRRTPLADSRFLFERRHGLSPLFHSELQEDVLHAREHSRQTRASESDDEAPRAQVVRHVHQGIHSEATGGAQSRQASPLLLRRRSARASDASPGVPRRRKRLPAPQAPPHGPGPHATGWAMVTARFVLRKCAGRPGLQHSRSRCCRAAVAMHAVGLHPCRPSERLIDPILPTRPRLLEVIKNIPVDAQRDLFFGAWERRSLRSRFYGLRRCSLKRRFGRIP